MLGLIESPVSHATIVVTSAKDAVTMRCIGRMSPSPRVRSAARPAWHALLVACGSPVCFASPPFSGFAFVASPAEGSAILPSVVSVPRRPAIYRPVVWPGTKPWVHFRLRKHPPDYWWPNHIAL